MFHRSALLNALACTSADLSLRTWELKPDVDTLRIDVINLKAREKERIPKKKVAGVKLSPGILNPVNSFHIICGKNPIINSASCDIVT